MKTIYSSVVAFLFVLAVAPFTGKANIIDNKETVAVSEKQVSVQYAGSADNNMVFHVTFNNPEAQKFTLIIKNEEGEVIYQRQFNDVHFSKSVHLLKEDAEVNPTFIVRVGNQKIERSFKESGDTGYMQEVTMGK